MAAEQSELDVPVPDCGAGIHKQLCHSWHPGKSKGKHFGLEPQKEATRSLLLLQKLIAVDGSEFKREGPVFS